ncbi:MAG TPA: hypothetical protein VJU78_10865 [Chitinophagaceae bacterium]|nr:hypothetical protein [Chitinophagaceae bacterium]
MNDIEQIKKELADFIERDKFQVYGYLQPGVENSTDDDKQLINEEIKACCNELLVYLSNENPAEEELKKFVRYSLERIEDAMLDTEDREFCYELFGKIGIILGIDIEDKTMPMEQRLMEDLQRLIKKTGLNPDDFLPLGSSLR